MARKKSNKILDNNYENTDINTGPINFSVSSDYSSNMSEEEKINYQIIMEKVDNLIVCSEFLELNNPNEDGKYNKLNKENINKVFTYIVKYLPKYSKIDIFSVICDYFDITYKKMYDSLSLNYKKELQDELKQGNYISSNNLF